MGWGTDLFSFKGRLNRARFWIYLAGAIPLCLALLIGFWAYALSIPGAYENGGPTPFPTSPLGIAAGVVFYALLALLLVSFLAISVKRLHDRDKAWWWVAIFLILPHPLSGLGAYFFQTGARSDIIALPLMAAGAIALWGFVELALLRGTAGANDYGPDPLAPPLAPP